MKMKIIVTGGAGFIGSHVSEYYARRGHEVKVIDNLSRSKIFNLNKKISMYNWKYLKDNYDNITLIRGDIRDYKFLEKHSKDADIIIHTAAQTAVTTSITDPRTDFETNTLGTFNVLEAAKRAKNKPVIIFCSTNKVYGNNVNKIPVEEGELRYKFSEKKFQKGIPESFPVDLCEHTPYGASKLAADIYVQDYAERNEIDAAVFRMSCVYGTRQFGVEDQGWVSWFTIATLSGKPLTIYGNGKQVRDVLFITDLVEVFDAFIEKRDKLHFGVYNMGGGTKNTLSLLELLDLIKRETGKIPKIRYDNWRPSDQKIYISDISKATNHLNWTPKTSPEEGIKKLIEWIKEKNILKYFDLK